MTLKILICAARDQALSGRERAALCFMVLASIVVALFALPGAAATRKAPIAIVFAPWVSGEQAVARSLSAGHLVLRSGRSPFIVIAAGNDTDNVQADRPKGALLMLALAGLAGCLDATATPGTAS